jgi:CBS domain-containing protein
MPRGLGIMEQTHKRYSGKNKVLRRNIHSEQRAFLLDLENRWRDRLSIPGSDLLARAQGGSPMNVKEILAAKGSIVLTIEPTADLTAATRVLTDNHIGALVICGVGMQMVGILSERDIVRALAKHGAEALNLPVGQVMTRDVETCSENESLASLMERMTAGKFRHLPVVEQGRLLGVISIGDVVKQRVQEIERDAEAMRDYIRS